ncbi:MAG: hypothetical protein ACYS6W_14615, partial [Planctomycetota bacterium]
MAVRTTQSSPLPNPITEGFLADDAVTEPKIKDGEIINADINASADIDGSKLLNNSVPNSKLSGSILKFADSDTDGEVNTSTVETTIASVTIPADTFTTRSIVIAPVCFSTNTTNDWGEFKIKI